MNKVNKKLEGRGSLESIRKLGKPLLPKGDEIIEKFLEDTSKIIKRDDKSRD